MADLAENEAEQLDEEEVKVKELKTKIEEERKKVRDVDGLKAYVDEGRGRWAALPTKKYKCQKTLRGHLAKVYALQWAGDGSRHIVSASQDGKLLVWDAMTGNKVNAIPLQNSWVMCCAFASNGGCVAAGGLDNCCSVYSLLHPDGSAQREQCRLQGHTGYLSSCHFLNGDKQMMTASGDHTCRLWDIDGAAEITRFTGHEADVMTIALSTDGRTMITGACDKYCKIWDVRDGRCKQSFETFGGDVNSVAFHPSGFAFASGSDGSGEGGSGGGCLLFDLRADQCVATYPSDPEDGGFGVMTIDFSKSGSILFAGLDNGDIVGWDVPAGHDIVHLNHRSNNGHESRVNCLQVSPDGQAMVSGSWDNSLKIWN